MQLIWIEIMKDNFHSNNPICKMTREAVCVWGHSLWKKLNYFQGSNKVMWVVTVVVSDGYLLLLSFPFFFFFASLFVRENQMSPQASGKYAMDRFLARKS